MKWKITAYGASGKILIEDTDNFDGPGYDAKHYAYNLVFSGKAEKAEVYAWDREDLKNNPPCYRVEKRRIPGFEERQTVVFLPFTATKENPDGTVISNFFRF